MRGGRCAQRCFASQERKRGKGYGVFGGFVLVPFGIGRCAGLEVRGWLFAVSLDCALFGGLFSLGLVWSFDSACGFFVVLVWLGLVFGWLVLWVCLGLLEKKEGKKGGGRVLEFLLGFV
jgi:hypothetical protein